MRVRVRVRFGVITMVRYARAWPMWHASYTVGPQVYQLTWGDVGEMWGRCRGDMGWEIW